MKNMTKLLVLAGLILAVAFSGCLGGDDPADNNTTAATGFAKDVKLSENNTVLTFTFSANPTTGYDWTLTENITGILNKTVDNYTASSDAPGASGVHTWAFTGEKAGIVTLNFIYARSFEDGSTIENLTYVIEVKEDKSIEIIASSTADGTGTFPKAVTLENENAVLKLVFTENPTTGYSWATDVSPANVLNKTLDNSSSAAAESDEPTTGAPSIHTWEYAGLKAGMAALTFDYNRSFEENSTTEKAIYTVIVDENNKIKITGILYDTLE